MYVPVTRNRYVLLPNSKHLRQWALARARLVRHRVGLSQVASYAHSAPLCVSAEGESPARAPAPSSFVLYVDHVLRLVTFWFKLVLGIFCIWSKSGGMIRPVSFFFKSKYSDMYDRLILLIMHHLCDSSMLSPFTVACFQRHPTTYAATSRELPRITIVYSRAFAELLWSRFTASAHSGHRPDNQHPKP